MIDELADRVIEPLRPNKKRKKEDAHAKTTVARRLAGTPGARWARNTARSSPMTRRGCSSSTARCPSARSPATVGALGRRVVRTIATAWQARLVARSPGRARRRASRAFADAVIAAHPGVHRDEAVALASRRWTRCRTACRSSRARTSGRSPTADGARRRRAAVPACSTAIAWGDATADGELLFARNFDFPGVGVWDAAPAFIVCAPDRGQRYGFFATRGADAPVVTVVNEAGLVIAPHTRWHRGVDAGGGAMIVDVVHDDRAPRRDARRRDPDRARAADRRRAGASRSAARARRSALRARDRRARTSRSCGPRPARRSSCARIAIAAPALQRRPDRRRRARGRCTPSVASAGCARSSSAAPRCTARDLARLPRRSPRCDGTRRSVTSARSSRSRPTSTARSSRRHRAARGSASIARRSAKVAGPSSRGRGTVRPVAGSSAAPTARASPPSRAMTSPRRTTQATRHVHEAARRTSTTTTSPARAPRSSARSPRRPTIRRCASPPRGSRSRRDARLARSCTSTPGSRRETEPYRRGQLLLWGAAPRSASTVRALASWIDELRRSGDGVDELRTAAARRRSAAAHMST